MANLTTRKNLVPALRQAFATMPLPEYDDVRDPINGKDIALYGQSWVNKTNQTIWWMVDEVNHTWVTWSAGSFTTLYATGDAGGVASTVGVTNVVNNTQGAGTLSISSTNANSGDNAGFIKGYVGTTTVYIPYFTSIAP